jgi:hypothetical protein
MSSMEVVGELSQVSLRERVEERDVQRLERVS